ncbi:MAG: hypothetical protein ACYDBJ_08145 [Aggregatilineales bacterium]
MPSAFKCPNCGAALEVIGGRTDVTCATCGTVTNLSVLLARMAPVDTSSNDRPGPLAWLIIGNRLGCCSCLAAIVTLIMFGVIALFVISATVPGGISGVLTQVAH